MLRKIFCNKRVDALRAVLENIFLERYKKNLDFNIAIIRDDINEMQVLNSAYFYHQREISDSSEFGFMIVIPFSTSKKKGWEMFEQSRFAEFFIVLERTKSYVLYYFDCKQDLVLQIRNQISEEIYGYTKDTLYKIVEYTS